MGYHWAEGVPMPDLLIRGVSEEVVARVDARAQRLGLSRSEYLRRQLAQEVSTYDGAVEVSDLARFTDAFADLADPEVMSKAWE